MAFDTSKLTPINLPYAKGNLWRVPLHKPSDEEYTLFVKAGFTRTFTDKTLPRSLRGTIAMILASGNTYTYIDEAVNEYNSFTVPMYIDPVWREIGWQVSPSWFCLCMTTRQITSLKGVVNETTNEDDI